MVEKQKSYNFNLPPATFHHEKMNSCIEQRGTTFRKRRRRSRSTVKRRKVEALHILCSDNSKIHFDASATASQHSDGILEKPAIRSLPMLLAFRRSGEMKGSSRRWRTELLKEKEKEAAKGRQWRRYAAKHIPFSSLQTPLTDAVLSLDRDGSYLISLGGRRVNIAERRSNESHPLLAVKFYRLPSPQALLQNKGSVVGLYRKTSQVVSPLLQMVPLLLDNKDTLNENRNNDIPSSIFGRNNTASFAANTPIQILLSSDSVCGVGFVHHSTASSSGTGGPSLPMASSLVESPAVHGEDSLGTILIFTLPGVSPSRSTTKICSFKCSNVRVAWKAFTMRNLLWKTQCIPNSFCENHIDGKFCDSVRNISGYILFNDEDDGFRLTWICHNAWNEDGEKMSISQLMKSPCKTQASRSDIVSRPEVSVWDECWHDRYSGSAAEPGNEKELDIFYEGYIRIDALLSSVLETKNYFRRRSPAFTDFYYNLVSVSDQGRTAVFVVVFANGSFGKGATSFGVVLRLDLFSQHYDEIEWVQHPSKPNPSFLQHWCNKLAINQRLKEQRIGPFCVGTNSNKQKKQYWPVPEGEANFDPTENANIEPEIWAEFVDSTNLAGHKTTEYPKEIFFCSLYRDCDMITNRAVTAAKPVSQLDCRDGPVTLVYG